MRTRWKLPLLPSRAAENLYWNTISGSPFYQVAQPWMKGYEYFAEFKVRYHEAALTDVDSVHANRPVELPADLGRVRAAITP